MEVVRASCQVQRLADWYRHSYSLPSSSAQPAAQAKAAAALPPSTSGRLTYCGGGVVKGTAALSEPVPRLLLAVARKVMGVS